MSSDDDKEIARQGRLVALVIAGAGALWVLAQVFGPRLGLAGEYAFLVDLVALAAFVWAMYVAYGMWRKRRD
ncbi:MAG: DUF5337 domain-containing protein [Deltaproteobacteria bacterium]